MKSFIKSFCISAALLASMFSLEASADGYYNKCTDCEAQYAARVSPCGDNALTIEAQSLCYTIARSNLDACTGDCTYSSGGDDDHDDGH